MTEKEKAAWIGGAKTAINCMRFTLELLERELQELADKAEEESPEAEAAINCMRFTLERLERELQELADKAEEESPEAGADHGLS